MSAYTLNPAEAKSQEEELYNVTNGIEVTPPGLLRPDALFYEMPNN
jgi:hypothetical protein